MMHTTTPFITNLDDLLHRPRRNRRSEAIRGLIRETQLHPNHFVAPLFVIEGTSCREPIKSMPGVERLTLDELIKEVKYLNALGVNSIDIFPFIPTNKRDDCGSEALVKDNILIRAIHAIKDAAPECCVMIDVALDPYTSHGHDGLIDSNGMVANDETVEILAKMSLLAAAAGADIVAPSDMMDGRVKAIRQALDSNGYKHVGILSYAAKYASAFYGPFREALNSAPRFGDKKSYQMDPANYREALLEAKYDENEGADMLLVKPALPYLDVIAKLRAATQLPIGAYHVSGEYAMALAAAAAGYVDADKILLESLLSIKRAGADFILTYAAKRVAEHLLGITKN